MNGHNKTAGGFIWKFATAKDVQKLPAETAKQPVSGKGKQVIRYSLEGKKLAVYSSLMEAAKACGVDASKISSALDSQTRSAAGFVWRTKGNIYLGGLAQTPSPNKAHIVTQYDLKGRKLHVYKSTREAGFVTGTSSSSSISMVARGKFKTTGGFIWQYGDGPAKIDIDEYFAPMQRNIRKVSKPVLEYSLAGELIKEYPSISEAARVEGIRLSRISSVINGKSKSAGGDYWKLKVD